MKVKGFRQGVQIELEVTQVQSGIWLRSDVAAAYLRMTKAAKKDGIKLWANSGFRSHAKQQILWDLWKAGKLKLRPCRPGFSQHNEGIAVDINRSHDDPDGNGPEIGTTDTWLRSNAAKFGFTNTVTGEPWHWAYVI